MPVVFDITSSGQTCDFASASEATTVHMALMDHMNLQNPLKLPLQNQTLQMPRA